MEGGSDEGMVGARERGRKGRGSININASSTYTPH